MLGQIEGKRRREWQRMRWLDSIMDSMDMNLNRLWETGKENRAWCAAVQTTTTLGRGIRRSMAQTTCLTTLELLLYKKRKFKIYKICSKTDFEMKR